MNREESLNGKLTSLAVHQKAKEMADILMKEENRNIVYTIVNCNEAKHPENRINRDYYSIAMFKQHGRRRTMSGIISLGYFDHNTKEYVPKQVGGSDATDVFKYVKKHSKK